MNGITIIPLFNIRKKRLGEGNYPFRNLALGDSVMVELIAEFIRFSFFEITALRLKYLFFFLRTSPRNPFRNIAFSAPIHLPFFRYCLSVFGCSRSSRKTEYCASLVTNGTHNQHHQSSALLGFSQRPLLTTEDSQLFVTSCWRQLVEPNVGYKSRVSIEVVEFGRVH